MAISTIRGIGIGIIVGVLIGLLLRMPPSSGVPDPGVRPSPNPGPSIVLPNDCNRLREAVSPTDVRSEGYVYRMAVLKCVDIPWNRLSQP